MDGATSSGAGVDRPISQVNVCGVSSCTSILTHYYTRICILLLLILCIVDDDESDDSEEKQIKINVGMRVSRP